jgi:hypothetical protein
MKKDEKIANVWLKQNGIAVDQLLKTDLLLQQAQIVATNLIKHHQKSLSNIQYQLLTDYTKSTKQTSNNAYQVLNLGKKINRQLFKESNANKSLR